MHKGQLIITKAESKEEALSKVRIFINEYKNDVWDWYQIGGRWTGVLCNIMKEYNEKADMFLKLKQEGKSEWISQDTVEKNLPKLQEMWREMGGQGTTPYASHYELPEDGGPYDVMKLSKCLSIVKGWQQTIETAKEEEIKAKRWIKDGKEDWNMYGYNLVNAGKLYQQDYFFETNVYNINKWNYSIPEDVAGYWVVVVDIHN